MRKNIINNMHDLSDRKRFVFSVECTVCGKKWMSATTAFTKASDPPTTHAEEIVYTALYQKEKQAAALKAIEEAVTHLNFCPVCKRIVCDGCFMICDEIDMCVECAALLEEKGELVETMQP